MNTLNIRLQQSDFVVPGVELVPIFASSTSLVKQPVSGMLRGLRLAFCPSSSAPVLVCT